MPESASGWFRIPGGDQHERKLMGLKPAQLKCYLVVARAIQCGEKNSGKLSVRCIAERAQLAGRHAHESLSALIAMGLLRCVSRPGSGAVYSLPVAFRGGYCLPAGEQSGVTAEHQLELASSVPTADCSPVGEQYGPKAETRECDDRQTLLAELEFERQMRVIAGLANGRGWRQIELYSSCRECAGFGRRNGAAGGPPCSCVAGEAFSIRSGLVERTTIDNGSPGVKHAGAR